MGSSPRLATAVHPLSVLLCDQAGKHIIEDEYDMEEGGLVGVA